MIDAAYDKLIARLRELGTPARAEKEKSYQKSAWQHWGVALPDMDRAIRQCLKGVDGHELLALAERLWAEPVWDLKMTAARIAALKRVEADDRLWAFVCVRVSELDGWALSDCLARAAWRCLEAEPGRLDAVEGWLAVKSLWMRRAVLIFTLPWTKGDRDPERMLGWASELSRDGAWFIQKAIGWWLRELGKTDPDRVRSFLADHEGHLKTVALKEAVKYIGG